MIQVLIQNAGWFLLAAIADIRWFFRQGAVLLCKVRAKQIAVAAGPAIMTAAARVIAQSANRTGLPVEAFVGNTTKRPGMGHNTMFADLFGDRCWILVQIMSDLPKRSAGIQTGLDVTAIIEREMLLICHASAPFFHWLVEEVSPYVQYNICRSKCHCLSCQFYFHALLHRHRIYFGI